jgi:glycosyltransferase involved in cell wall biosynthesis
MRVVHVIPGLAARQGGPPMAVTASCVALQKHGVETVIFTTDLARPASSPRAERLVATDLPRGAEKVDVRIFPAVRPRRFAYAPKLYEALRREASRYDLMHIHGLYLYPTFAAFRATREQGVPYVVSPRGTLDPALRHRSRRLKAINDFLWQRRMLNGAAVLHYTTSEEAALVADLELRPPAVVAPNGIEFGEFAVDADGAAFRRRYLDSFDGPIVLSFGRISHKKGIDVLIRALARLTSVDARLVVAGPDDEHLTPKLNALAAAEGVAGRVVFVGPLRGDDRVTALAAATVWALPSTTENFGNAVLEAMAAGAAVVISRDVNLARAIEEAGAGVVRERTPEAFATEVDLLLSDEGRRVQLGRAAREFAKGYDWEVVVPQLLQTYEHAISRAQAPSRMVEPVT